VTPAPCVEYFWHTDRGQPMYLGKYASQYLFFPTQTSHGQARYRTCLSTWQLED